MVYTLGSVVNSVQSEFPAVRLSTLVEHLDSLIRTHARLMKDRRLPMVSTANSFHSSLP
jgi:hypothetical protein